MRKHIKKFKKGFIFLLAVLALTITSIVIPLSKGDAAEDYSKTQVEPVDAAISLEILKSTVKITGSSKPIINKELNSVSRENSTEKLDDLTNLKTNDTFLVSIKYTGKEPIIFPHIIETSFSFNMELFNGASTGIHDYQNQFPVYFNEDGMEPDFSANMCSINANNAVYTLANDSTCYLYEDNNNPGTFLRTDLSKPTYDAQWNETGMTGAEHLLLSPGDVLGAFKFRVLMDIPAGTSFDIPEDIGASYLSYYKNHPTQAELNNNVIVAFPAVSFPAAAETDLTLSSVSFNNETLTATNNEYVYSAMEGDTFANGATFTATAPDSTTITYSSTSGGVYNSSVPVINSSAGKKYIYAKVTDKNNAEKFETYTLRVDVYPKIDLQGKYSFNSSDYALLDSSGGTLSGSFAQASVSSNGTLTAGTLVGYAPNVTGVNYKLITSGLSSGASYSIGTQSNLTTTGEHSFNTKTVTLTVTTSDGLTTTYNITIKDLAFNNLTGFTVDGVSGTISGFTGKLDILDFSGNAAAALVANALSGYTITYGTSSSSITNSACTLATNMAGKKTAYIRVSKWGVYTDYTITISVYPTISGVTAGTNASNVAFTQATSVGDSNARISLNYTYGVTTYGLTINKSNASYTLNLSNASSIAISTTNVIVSFDGLSTTYKINASSEAASTDNTLNALTVGGVDALSNAATSGGYSADFAVGSSVNISLTRNDSSATVSVNGNAVTLTGDTYTYNHTVVSGANTINIVVTSQSGAKKTYKVVLNGKSTDSSIATSGVKYGTTSANQAYTGTIQTSTSTSDTTHVMSLGYVIGTGFVLQITTKDTGATITSSFGTVTGTSGTYTIKGTLAAGENFITITVNSAAGGSNVSYYRFKIVSASTEFELYYGSTSTAVDNNIATTGTSHTISPKINKNEIYLNANPNSSAKIVVEFGGSPISGSGTIYHIAGLTYNANNVITIKIFANENLTTTPDKVFTLNVPVNNNDTSISSVKVNGSAITAVSSTYSKLDIATSNSTVNVAITPKDSNASVKSWLSSASEPTGATGTTFTSTTLDPVSVVTYNFRIIAQNGVEGDIYSIELRQVQAVDTSYASVVYTDGTNTYQASNGVITVPYNINTFADGHSLTATANSTASKIAIGSTESTGTSPYKVSINGTGVSIPINGASGLCEFTITVTAQDGTSTQEHKIKIVREKSDDASLSSLVLNTPSGTTEDILSKFTAQNSYKYEYTTGYKGNTTSISFDSVTATKASEGATIKYVGNSFSGIGKHTVTIEVTAPNGTKREYKLTITVLSNDVSASLAYSGTASGSFTFGSNVYKATVTNDISSVNLTATPATGATVAYYTDAACTQGTVSGVSYNSWSLNVENSISSCNNKLYMKVTAEDGTTKVYTIEMTREASKNSDISSISGGVSSGSLSTISSNADGKYKAAVENVFDTYYFSVKLPNGSTAKIYYNGSTIGDSSETSASIAVGDTTLSITVKSAYDELHSTTTNSTTYELVIHRKSNDSTLNGLVFANDSGSGTVDILSQSPQSSDSTTSGDVVTKTITYNVEVAYGFASGTLKGTKNNSHATISQNDVPVTPEFASYKNGGTIRVTSEDGKSVTEYVVYLSRTMNSKTSVEISAQYSYYGSNGSPITTASSAVTVNSSFETSLYTVDNSEAFKVTVTFVLKNYTTIDTDSLAGWTFVSQTGSGDTHTCVYSFSPSSGKNSISITLLAQDGAPQIYVFNYQKSASTNTKLDKFGFKLAAADEVDNFETGHDTFNSNANFVSNSSTVTNFIISNVKETNEFYMFAKAINADATVSAYWYNGSSTSYSSAWNALPLNATGTSNKIILLGANGFLSNGEKTMSICVEVSLGASTKTYYYAQITKKNTEAEFDSITLNLDGKSAETINFASFTKDSNNKMTATATTTLANDKQKGSITFNSTLTNSTVTFGLEGATFTIESSTASSMNFKDVSVGKNIIILTVRSEDYINNVSGKELNYYLAFNREPNSNCKLDSLTITPKDSSNANINSAKWDTSFNSNVMNYNILVAGVSKVEIAATAASTSTIAIYVDNVSGAGNPSPVTLSYSGNSTKYIIQVTAEDNSTVDYIVTVYKTQDLSLQSITANDGSETGVNVALDTLKANIAIGATTANLNAVPTTPNDVDVTYTADPTFTAGGQKRTITITVTSKYTPMDTKEYVVELTRTFDTESRLNSLSINNQSILPDFDKDVYSYTLTVPHRVSSVSLVWAAMSDYVKSVTCNGSTSGNVNLAFGLNTINVVVTPEDSSAGSTYTINVTREREYIEDITINGIGLEGFNRTQQSGYVYEVSDNVETIVIGGKVSKSTSNMSGDIGEVAIHANQQTIALSIVDSTGANLTNTTYTVTIKRISATPTEANPNISDLNVKGSVDSKNVDFKFVGTSGQTMSFDSTYTGPYYVTVPNTTTKVTVEYVLNNISRMSRATSTIYIDGNAVSNFNDIPLEAGKTREFSIATTNTKGESVTYYIYVSRLDESGNSTDYEKEVPYLTDLKVFELTGSATGSYTPNELNYVIYDANYIATTVTFAPEKTYNYMVVVDSNSVSLVQFASTLSSGTVVKYNGSTDPIVSLNPIASDAEYSLTTVEVLVLNGDISYIYYVDIYAGKDGLIPGINGDSDNNDLSDLTIAGATLSPEFSSSNQTYTTTIFDNQENITINAPSFSKDATVQVSGVPGIIDNGDNTFTIPVDSLPESGTITVTVTSASGSEKEYTISYSKVTPDNDITLSSLEISNTLFTTTIDLYSTSIKEDQYYKTFSPNDIIYYAFVGANVSNVQVLANAAKSTSTIEYIHASEVVGQSYYQLAFDTSKSQLNVYVKVTAEDGTVQVYTIYVLRDDTTQTPEIDPTLEGISISDGTNDYTTLYNQNLSSNLQFDPSFYGMYYTVVENDVTSITATGKLSNEALAAGYTIETDKIAYLLPNPTSKASSTLVKYFVKDSNGMIVRTYYLTVYRNVAGHTAPGDVPGVSGEAIPTANLSSITVNKDKKSTPAGTYAYTFTVPMTTKNITLDWAFETEGASAVAVKDGQTYARQATIPVELGDNTIVINVSNKDARQTYTVTVHRTTADEMVQNVTVTTRSDANNNGNADHVKKGENFNLIVGLKGTNISFNEFGIRIPYDSTKFNYIGYSAIYAGVNVSASANYLTISYYSATNQISGSALDLVSLEFKAIDDETSTIDSYTFEASTDDSSMNIAELDPATDNIIYHTLSASSTTVSIDAKSNDNKLSGLIVEGYPLSANENGTTITFDPNTEQYYVLVPNTETKITINPTAANSFASVEIVGATGNSINLNDPTGAYPSAVKGTTNISVVVTAEDGTKKTYTITVLKDFFDDATLKNVQINGEDIATVLSGVTGQENFVFDPNTTTYTITIPFAFGNQGMTFTGVPTQNTSEAKTNIQGQTTNILFLDLGKDATVNIIVTAQNGDQKTYVFNLHKEECAIDDAKLIDMGVVGYLQTGETTLNSLYDSNGNPTKIVDGVYDYQLSVPYSISNLAGDLGRFTLYGIASATNIATIKITDSDGRNLTNYDGAVQVSIPANSFAIYTFEVTAKDGTTTQTYTLKVTRLEISTDTSIASAQVKNTSDLSITYPWMDSEGTEVDLDFAQDMHIFVPYSVVDVTTLVTTSSPAARYIISGGKNLGEGSNTVTIMVLAESNDFGYYTFTVNRKAISNNTAIADISVPGGHPVTDASGRPIEEALADPTTIIKDFYVTVPYACKTLVPIVTPMDNTSTMTVIAPEGELKIGEDNLFIYQIIAENGKQDVYKLHVTRKEASSETGLNSILINGDSIGTLDNPTNRYSYVLGSDVLSAEVTAVLKDNTSHFENGTTNYAETIETLKSGAYTVLIKVIAENGRETVHVVTIEKEKGLGEDATLDSLGADYTLYDAQGNQIDFSPEVKDYHITLGSLDNVIIFDPVLTDKRALFEGTKMATIPAGGQKVFTWRVTSENELFETIYTITVTRELSSSDATLKTLEIAGITLDKIFVPAIKDYKITVPANTGTVYVTAQTNDPNAKILSGTGSQLINTAEVSVIKIIVMAQDGITMAEYTITTTVSSDSTLKTITFENGSTVTLTPGVTNYSVTMNDKAMDTTVTAVANSSVASVVGNGDYSLKDGENTIYVSIVAEDGTVTTYTFTVTADAGMPMWIFALIGMGALDVLLILGIIILAVKRKHNDTDVEEE